MARTAPIRGSCSHRYFAIFFFFFFCVAMAYFLSSGSYGKVEFKALRALSRIPWAFASLPPKTMPQDERNRNGKNANNRDFSVG